MANKKIDDSYVLGKDKLTTHEAADYLGMSWWRLTAGLQRNEFPFGTATLGKTGTQYIYTIYAEAVYNFKHGIVTNDNSKIIELFKEAIELMTKAITLMEERQGA